MDENDMIDVSIDNYDTTMEKEGRDVIIDDLETIRFESVPEKQQVATSIPIPMTDCSIFGWIFMCFT